MAIRVFDIIVGIIIVAMFVGGMSAYFVQVNQTYDLNLSESEFNTFNKIESIINLTEEQGIAITGSDIDTETDSITTFFKGTFNGAKRLLTAPTNIAKVGFAMVTDAFDILARLGIPIVFSLGLTAILSVVIIFALIRAVLKVIP